MENRSSLPILNPGPASTPAPPMGRQRHIVVDTTAEAERSANLFDALKTVRRHKGAVILGAFLGLLAAILATLPQTPVYQARASLEIQNVNRDFMNMNEINPVAESGGDYTVNHIQTHIKLLQSETLLKRVTEKVRRTAIYKVIPPGDRMASWKRALSPASSTPSDRREEALAAVRRSLKVRASGQTRIVEVLCDSTDPRLAADFANALANDYIDQTMEARWQMNERMVEWLERQLEDMRIKLERSEEQLQGYARSAGLLFTGDKEKQNFSEEKLRQIQQELSRAQADRIGKQSRWETARSGAGDALPDLAGESGLREYQSKLTELRRQQAELSETYKPEYAKVRRVTAQITTIEAALAASRASILSRLRNEYEEAEKREALLVGSYRALAKLVTSESEKSIQYNILKREVDSTRQLYDAMSHRVKESSIASALRASNIRIVDLATPPKEPYKPTLPLNAIFGLTGGAILSIAFVLLREHADRTLQEPGDALHYLGLPELGVVPAAQALPRDRFRGRLRMAEPKATRNGAVAGTNGINGASPVGRLLPDAGGAELVTAERTSSLAAEAFRGAVASIMFSDSRETRPRAIAFSSAGPAEGKTTVACNIAIALAEIRQRVVLIDADLRRSRLHEIFHLPNQLGLSTLLQARTLDRMLVEEVVQRTHIPDLYVLTAGPLAPATQLHSPRLPELIELLKSRFDMILIDTPPLLQMPDARVVGRQTDGVVLVIRAGLTTRDAALAAKSRLDEDGTRVIGATLNYWTQKGGAYYGYKSGYEYYRKAESPKTPGAKSTVEREPDGGR
jgi:capsular exopolysaccharide synthesis family protein